MTNYIMIQIKAFISRWVFIIKTLQMYCIDKYDTFAVVLMLIDSVITDQIWSISTLQFVTEKWYQHMLLYQQNVQIMLLSYRKFLKWRKG